MTSLTIANGERFDFLISSEGKEAKSYQMTFAGAQGSWTDCSGLATLAFIQYEDAPVDQAAVPDYAGGISAFFIGLASLEPTQVNAVSCRYFYWPAGLVVLSCQL